MSKLATLEAVARQLFSKYTAVIKTAVEKMSGDVEDHLEDKANPHGVTKAQVGLSDVQNHGMANKAEAEAGTASGRYMSPVRTKEAIAKFAGDELASHVADSNNPHGVTKDQVGLGNVQNYGMANKTEAEAGTATNKYMTPLRTKEAIDSSMEVIDASKVSTGTLPQHVLPAMGNASNALKLEGKTASQIEQTASDDAVARVNTRLAPIQGSKNEAVFFSDTNQSLAFESGKLLSPVGLYTDQESIDIAKAAVVPFSEIFDKWKRISHNTSGNFPANTGELTGWSYDPTTDVIQTTINSGTYIGFISEDRFDEYVLEAVIKSTAADDDLAGFCIAFREIDGKEYTLSAMATPGAGGILNTATYNTISTESRILVCVNCNQGSARGYRVIADLKLGTPNTPWNAGNYVNGIRLKVTRFKNGTMRIQSTRHDGTPWPNAIDWTGDIPDEFLGPCQWGFVAHSQANTSFNMIATPTVKSPIVDRRDGSVWTWEGNEWLVTGNINSGGGLIPGRFYKNIVGPGYEMFFIDYDGTPYVMGSPGRLHL